MTRPTDAPGQSELGLPPTLLVLTGGGTGGHLYPAISIARACSAVQVFERSGVQEGRSTSAPGLSTQTQKCLTPVFIGTRTGIEGEVVPGQGFPFYAITSRKVTRSLSPDTLLSLGTIAWGTVQAGILLRRLRPVAVIGTGGYASAGVVLAAALQGIPTLIHEQNSVPGRTNRLLARFVRRVAVTFEESVPFFPASKSVVTGLPVRPEIAAGQRDQAAVRYGLQPDRPTLLVLGGSLGARSLNRAVREALPLWSNSGVQVIHQVGRGNWGEHRDALGQFPDWYRPMPYLEEMGDAYAAADLIVCRAGASTLAEVAMVGLPSVLVPYQYAHADHQTHNARSVVQSGAGVLLPDAELSGPRLASQVESLLADPERRRQMADASRRRARPDAAAAILRAMWDMIDGLGITPLEQASHGTKRGAA